MTNPVVTVNVSVQNAPSPATLQRTGALVSQGGTNTAPGTKSLLTSAADLTALLSASVMLASLTQTAGLATATLESTTITAGTYNAVTGEVVLTLSASIGASPGDAVKVSGTTGTGSHASIEGVQRATAGSAGTTLHYFVAAALTMTITGGNAEATTGLANGATFWTTIAGASQTGYNGRVLATVTGDTTFTYAVPSTTVSPATGAPTMLPAGTVELQQMVTTFFAQGRQLSVYVLELGPGTPAQGVTFLGAYIPASPQFFYAYLVPRSWAAEATFEPFAATFEATTAKTYFYATVTAATYAAFANVKSVNMLIESPLAAATEFQHAADFWVTLNNKPSGTNKVTPLNLAFLLGVTAYPTDGTAALLQTLNAANVSFVGTGAEGGISDTILIGGNFADGNPFKYWYSVDWAQINLQRNLTAYLINGANNPQNPVDYNQDGINGGQQVLVSTMNQGITNGLVLNPVKATTYSATDFEAALESDALGALSLVNADPFPSYVTENPNDYAAGVYDGYSIDFTPLRGFESITINMSVSQFAQGA